MMAMNLILESQKNLLWENEDSQKGIGNNRMNTHASSLRNINKKGSNNSLGTTSLSRPTFFPEATAVLNVAFTILTLYILLPCVYPLSHGRCYSACLKFLYQWQCPQCILLWLVLPFFCSKSFVSFIPMNMQVLIHLFVCFFFFLQPYSIPSQKTLPSLQILLELWRFPVGPLIWIFSYYNNASVNIFFFCVSSCEHAW